jgi:hypothetical protein
MKGPTISIRFGHWKGIGLGPEWAEIHGQGRQPLGKRIQTENPASAGRRSIVGKPASFQGLAPQAINCNPSGVDEVAAAPRTQLQV